MPSAALFQAITHGRPLLGAAFSSSLIFFVKAGRVVLWQAFQSLAKRGRNRLPARGRRPHSETVSVRVTRGPPDAARADGGVVAMAWPRSPVEDR
ncbi:hypothetical protein K491DRAFT_693041 [Lophiostoma macrostomum CBS 122681]|uniref:Uncharacterized protein n=1 Tax=Lophiostoma macrostomum CBS 122681 TaxID=1314788 RepID=A0A6A6T8M3_9PLEO|nr:hypothetical protein K491DRAFT_693041 [Lophiostoma macrostomum CBS 122681]